MPESSVGRITILLLLLGSTISEDFYLRLFLTICAVHISCLIRPAILVQLIHQRRRVLENRLRELDQSGPDRA